MRVHDLKDRQGRVFAFEVSNTIIRPSGACVIVANIPGLSSNVGAEVAGWPSRIPSPRPT